MKNNKPLSPKQLKRIQKQVRKKKLEPNEIKDLKVSTIPRPWRFTIFGASIALFITAFQFEFIIAFILCLVALLLLSISIFGYRRTLHTLDEISDIIESL